LLLIGQQGWDISSGIGHRFPLAGGLCILHQHWRKTTNTAPTTLSAIQASRQSNFINEQLYSTCDQQLTLLSQRKQELTAINELFAFYNHGSS
jgi:hypothetical protein